MVAKLQPVLDDSLATLTSLSIFGMASADGPLSFNTQRVVVIATWTFGNPAAVVAQQGRRKATAVKKEDNLVVGL